MKLRYPENGMMSICRGDIEDAGDHLSSACSSTSFDIPSGFPQRNYLYGLDGRINDFRGRLNNIGVKIHSTDDNLREMSNSLKANASSLMANKMQKRDRTIV